MGSIRTLSRHWKNVNEQWNVVYHFSRHAKDMGKSAVSPRIKFFELQTNGFYLEMTSFCYILLV